MSNDPFDDIRASLGGTAGMFNGAEALNHQDQIRTAAKPEGYELEFSCEYCGTRHKMAVDWGSVAMIAVRVVPPGWTIMSGHFVATVPCKICREESYPGVTIGECVSGLQTAVRQGFVHQAQVQAIQQQATQRQAAMSGAMQRR